MASFAIIFVVIIVVQYLLPAGILRLVLGDLFLWLVTAAAILGAGVWARRWLNELGMQRRELLWTLLLFCFIYIAGYIFVHIFFAAEQDIKVYDSTQYWTAVITDQKMVSESIPAYLIHLRETFSREYNNLAALPLIPLTRLLGTDFAGYCLSILFIYYLPACLFLSIFILRLFKRARGSTPGAAAFIPCLCLCALSVAFLWPVMNGYLDVVGALLFALLLNATLDWDCTIFTFPSALCFAGLTLLLVLSRRWYAFNVAGIYFSFGVVTTLGMLARREFTLAKFGGILLNMAAIAAVCVLCFALINPALFTLFLGGDYATAFSGYKNMSMVQNLWMILANLGLLWVAAAFIGMRLLLQSDAVRPVCFRLLLTAIISFILFCRIQDMGYHQSYLVIPTLLIFAGVAYASIGGIVRRQRRIPLIALLLVVTVANFLFGYIPGLQSVAAKTEPFTTVMRRYPRINEDYAIIRQVVEDLAERTRDTSQLVYVIGDGSALSPEILKRSHLPEQTDAAPFVLVNNIVDLRDGFPSQLFMADYVVLRDPFVTEFSTPQLVSREANDMLLHSPDTALYYRREGSYAASGGDIVVFRKIQPVNTGYVDNLSERLRQYYPDQPFVYEPNYFIALLRIDPETEYLYNPWDDNSITLPKKATQPIEMRLDGLAGQTTLSFSLSCWEEGLEISVQNQYGEIFSQAIARTVKDNYEIDVAGSDFLTITIAEADQSMPVAGGIIMYHPELN